MLDKLKQIKIFRKKTLWFLVVFLIFYIGFFAYLIFNQDKIIYHPPNKNFYFCDQFPAKTKMIEYKNTRMYYRYNENSDKVVVFYHGNGNVVCDLGFLANSFEVSGVSYIFTEYDGYGGDGKIPSSDQIKNNVQDVIDFVNEKNYKQVYIVGQSVGTGVASYHASKSSPDKLLLISPLDSISEVAKKRFFFYPDFLIDNFIDNSFDSIENLLNYKNKIVIFHGNKDIVIPLERGQNLFENLKTEDKKMIIIDGFGHNDILNNSEVIDKIKEFVKN